MPNHTIRAQLQRAREQLVIGSPLIDLPEVMTANEVGAFLHLSPSTVNESRRRYGMPHRHLGRRVLYPRAAVLEWIVGEIKTPEPNLYAIPCCGS